MYMYNTCITQCGIHRDGPGGLALCVLKDIPILNFSLWFKCTRLLAYRYGQNVTLVKNGSIICPGKVLNLNSQFQNSCSVLSRRLTDSSISLTAQLTNM